MFLFNNDKNKRLVSFAIKNGGKVFKAEDYATYDSFLDDYKRINKTGLQIDTKYVPVTKVVK